MGNIKSRKLLNNFSYEKCINKCISVSNVRYDKIIFKKSI